MIKMRRLVEFGIEAVLLHDRECNRNKGVKFTLKSLKKLLTILSKQDESKSVCYW